MKTVTAPCLKRDARGYRIKKYSNVSIEVDFKTVRDLNPDISKLSESARWLYENCSTVVYGHYKKNNDILAYNGKTMHEMYEDKLVKAYDIKPEKFYINWLFSIIMPEMSDEEYFENEIKKLILNGAVELSANGKFHTLPKTQI